MKGNELNSALLAKLKITSVFNTSVGGRVFVNQAPLGTATPYCVINTPSDASIQDTGNEYENVIIQFDILTEEKTGAIAGRIRSELEDLLDGAKSSLTVENRKITSFKRTSSGNSSNDNIFHVYKQYRIQTQIIG
jgi:hypothetical protein